MIVIYSKFIKLARLADVYICPHFSRMMIKYIPLVNESCKWLIVRIFFREKKKKRKRIRVLFIFFSLRACLLTQIWPPMIFYKRQNIWYPPIWREETNNVIVLVLLLVQKTPKNQKKDTSIHDQLIQSKWSGKQCKWCTLIHW